MMRGRSPLAPRQVELLALIAEGHSNKEIACRMGTTKGTVGGYIFKIFVKLNVGNRVQAARWVWQNPEHMRVIPPDAYVYPIGV